MEVALGVAGGIAAYKACEIIRGLDRCGVGVNVILTRNGSRFITPLTLQTLSRKQVLVDQFDLTSARTVRHIELTKRIDAMVVAPATADILAKFANGVADDFLSTFYLAVTAPVVLAPAMNTRMWNHPATVENLRVLQRRGAQVVEPGSGWLAEGEEGPGRMAEPEEIVREVLRAAARSTQLDGKTVVVTAGPTREPLDPVRFISNRSSGKMGYALAAEAARRGARSILVSGPVDRPAPYGVEVHRVETAEQMLHAVMDFVDGADALFMAAAVSDYIPEPVDSKIKKTGAELTLTMRQGTDILQMLGEENTDTLLVGFAAETEDLVENAVSKLQRKNLDFIVANDVSGEGCGIEADDNEVTIIGRDGKRHDIGRDSKPRVAAAILDRIFGGRSA